MSEILVEETETFDRLTVQFEWHCLRCAEKHYQVFTSEDSTLLARAAKSFVEQLIDTGRVIEAPTVMLSRDYGKNFENVTNMFFAILLKGEIDKLLK